MTELICTWASLARPSLAPAPALQAADGELLGGWYQARDKGAYVATLPARDAARLCDLLTTESGASPGRAKTGRPKRRMNGEDL